MVQGDQKFKRFLNSIGIIDVESFDMRFLSIIKDPNKDNFFIYDIEKDTPWNFKLVNQFINSLNNIVSYDYKLNFEYKHEIEEIDIISLIKDWYFNHEFKECPFNMHLENHDIILTFFSDEDEKDFDKIKLDLKSFLDFINYNFNIKEEIKNTDEIEEVIDDIDTKNEEVNEEETSDIHIDNEEDFNKFKEQKEKELVEALKANYERMIEERRHNNVFVKGNYKEAKLGYVDSNSGAIDFNGFIFECDSKDTKTGKKLYKIGVNDDTGAIYVTFISNANALTPEKLSQIKVGKNIRIKGRVDIDKFKKEPFVMAHYFDMLPDTPLRTDDYEGEKRVELHVHTKMSEMDAVTTITDYCKLAKNMGHKAIGLTDHGVVQAFPEAQAASKKTGVKILYGSELYISEDYLTGALNPTDDKLKDVTFVCFDLETTGLSIRYDRITEFGAVKIVNGFVTDRLDILINPTIPIPKKIEEKTNITNEMVKDQPTFKEVYNKIHEFIKGSVLVSHNIEFDFGMLNEAMERDGFGSLTMSAIDTLALSRYIFPENQNHNLGALCRRLDVNYDTESAHRADYDAEVLSKCFMALRADFVRKNSDVTLKDIEKLPISPLLIKHRRYRTWHATVYAKNIEGLHDLYRIISYAHTENMGYVPICPRSILEKYRKNLIIGSACFNGEVFYSSTNRGLKSLQKAINFYDFIEIQPIDCYSFLINIGELPSYEQLKIYLLDIINEAKRQNKIICATGDVHYANPSDKIYRDVFIASQAVGAIDHPLNPKSRKKGPLFENPNQHYLSTTEMLEAFKWLENDEDIYNFVIKNPNYIADQVEDIQPIPPGLFPPKIDNCENLLRDLCYKTAHELYGETLPPLIEKRLGEELHGIISNGYSVTYYIAHKLVQQANIDGYIIGSRGSVGSSFAATMAGITEVNPLPPHYRCPKCKHVEFYEGDDITSGYDLPEKKCPHCGEKMISDGQSIPFQTFLGFKAEKVPDIDLNFPTDYQATAHNYTKVLLGEKNVYRAGTISTVQLKTAFGYVKKAYFEEFLHMDSSSISNARVAAIAYGCQEVKRTTGQHPGGIVVIPRDHEVYDFTPVQYPAGDTDAAWQTTHFDFHAIHDTVLKLDMLGHVDPQALKMMGDLTNTDCRQLPPNDPKVISLFSSDEALNLEHKYLPKDNGALGLPEFGTPFVRQMLRETNPTSFRDLLIISGLSHGTNVWNNNAQDLIEQKITDLRGVIGCRDDIMTYLISMNLDPHDAFVIMENVRKGKGLSKEDKENMLAHGVPQYYIDSCIKIKYLFPKGHACAYVMMALRVGYYKIYYPLEFYATFFTLRCDQYDIVSMIGGSEKIHDKLMEYKQRMSSNNPELALSVKEEEIEKTLQIALEMTERGFKFENIDIEKSDSTKFIVDKENNALIPPFKVLDGLGEKVGDSIVKARNEKSFISKEDLLKRGKISKTNLEQLEKLGALDNLSDTAQLSLFDFNF